MPDEIAAAIDRHQHWDGIYRSKDEAQLSWHQDDPRKGTSFSLITEFAQNDSRIIDIGGGSSTLSGDLVSAGFSSITVMDISESAVLRAKSRVGVAASKIQWLVADVTASTLLPGSFDLWHDRAVFHFLIDPADRRKYIDRCARSITPGGHAIIATFALDGPEKCSGLPVQRYDAAGIANQFAPAFALVKSASEMHMTPWGKPQAFMFAVLRRV